MTADTLDVLLVEDNPGDVRLVEEMLREAQNLLHRVDLDGPTPERIEFHHERDLNAAIEFLGERPVDVVLLDFGLPDSTGLDTLDRMLSETGFTPVIVLTGLDDRGQGIQAIQRGAEDYLVKNEASSELLIHSIQYAIGQTRQERERVRYREQLEALNELNTINQEITHDVITTSTREELETAVCERLVESDDFTCAWIGDVDHRSEEMAPRASAGTDGLLSDLPVSFTDGAREKRPETSAASSREVQVRQDIRAQTSEYGAHAREYGYQSVATIPLTYQSVFYGILAIYATSPSAFSEHETAILSRLGDVIGHALTAIERKKALVSDTALQLEFRVEGVAPDLVEFAANQGCTLTIDTLVRSKEGLLVYGAAEGLPRVAFQHIAEETPAIAEFRILSSEDDSHEFEFITTEFASLDRVVADHGGHVESARVEAGEFRFVVEFPPGRDKHQIVELVEGSCPGATLEAHRTVSREDPSVPDSRSVFQNRLTEKQRAALKTAYHAGYFEWPRSTSGGDVAELLGITQATFSQHFRAAEREFFSAIFEGDGDQNLDESSPWRSSESEATHE